MVPPCSHSYLSDGVVVAVGGAAAAVERGLLEGLVLEVPLPVVLQDLGVVGHEARHGVPEHKNIFDHCLYPREWPIHRKGNIFRVCVCVTKYLPSPGISFFCTHLSLLRTRLSVPHLKLQITPHLGGLQIKIVR